MHMFGAFSQLNRGRIRDPMAGSVRLCDVDRRLLNRETLFPQRLHSIGRRQRGFPLSGHSARPCEDEAGLIIHQIRSNFA